MQNISQLISDIRALINKPRKQHLLLKDSAAWYMLCSSLDVIADADLCLEAFLATDIDGFDAGNKYMYVYGTLQALIVQQDAVKHLNESLKIQYTPDQNLNEIREIRNDSVGHPTKRGGSVEQFKAELEKRDILEAYDITYNLELIDYPLQELKKYFSSPGETHINKKDAYIFAYFVNQQIEGLFKIAKELDEEYSQ